MVPPHKFKEDNRLAKRAAFRSGDCNNIPFLKKLGILVPGSLDKKMKWIQNQANQEKRFSSLDFEVAGARRSDHTSVTLSEPQEGHRTFLPIPLKDPLQSLHL